MPVTVNRIREILDECVQNNPEIGELPFASFVTIYADDVAYGNVRSGVLNVFLIEDEKPGATKIEWPENINT